HGSLPHSEQESLKDGSRVLSFTLLYIGDLIGKGVFFALGAYLGYSQIQLRSATLSNIQQPIPFL
uniref:hypothetical protein n=1 Tax=Vibrio sonorensis TaxID=1004316 RepID=UPI001C2FD4E9